MIASSEAPVTEFPLKSTAESTNRIEFLVDWFEQFAGTIGLPCACYERDTHHVIARSDGLFLPFTPIEFARQTTAIQGMEIHPIGYDLLYFLTPLPVNHNYLIGGFARTSQSNHSGERLPPFLETRDNAIRFEEWRETLPICDPRLLECLLTCSTQSANRHRREVLLQLEVHSLAQQVNETNQQIELLNKLTEDLRVSRPPEEFIALCLDRLYSVVDCGSCAIWLTQQPPPQGFQFRGDLSFDQTGFARLLKRFQQYNWSKAMVRNQLQDTLFGSVFPGLKNFVIASIGDDAQRLGWIVACNLSVGRDFGSAEASLFSSVAILLGTHLQKARLSEEQNDLELSFVRSLVSTLDSKDAYTRGHSERVALIARRLGEEFHLSQSDLDDIYLSSLLHDLGKIGVDDRILSKPENLTAEEFAEIQRHPMIGYEILSPLSNLQRILPGVRNHHEAFNGKGYPDRLQGEEIPFMARIIAVADAYDAMASDRPYRGGMPLPQLDDIFRRGSGEQWDPKVIEAYFAVRDEIHALFGSYSSTVGSLLDSMILNNSAIFQLRESLRPTV